MQEILRRFFTASPSAAIFSEDDFLRSSRAESSGAAIFPRGFPSPRAQRFFRALSLSSARRFSVFLFGAKFIQTIAFPLSAGAAIFPRVFSFLGAAIFPRAFSFLGAANFPFFFSERSLFRLSRFPLSAGAKKSGSLRSFFEPISDVLFEKFRHRLFGCIA